MQSLIKKAISGELITNPNSNDIVKVLKHASKKYYNEGVTIISDDLFDMLKDKLKEIDPDNIYLQEVGAPVKNKVKLPYVMPSLDKIKDDTALDTWTSKYTGPYILSDKLDGVSGQLFVKDNKYFLYTRGDRVYGHDITHLIKYFIPEDVLSNIPTGTSIRGEIIMSKINFQKYKDTFSNMRNMIAGLVNSKTININLARDVHFVSYNIIHPRLKPEEQLKLLNKYGLRTVHYKKVTKLDTLTNYLKDRRQNSEYDVDGIVVADNKVYELDQDKAYPDDSFAFKTLLDDQQAETTVVDVIWQVSKDGYIKPKLQVQPVELVGVTITNVTAFNAKYVVDNKIGIGSKLLIARSGDVIPHILKVITPGQEKMPDIPYEWNESKVDFIIKEGTTNDTMDMKHLLFFFKTLEVKNLDESTLTKIIEGGYNTVEKILAIKDKDKEKLYKINGLSNKIVDKIFNNIDKSIKNTTLSTFMAASQIFGRGIGRRKIDNILESYPDILNNKWSKDVFIEKINKVEGFSDIMTNKFVENFDEFLVFFNNVNKIVDLSYLLNKDQNLEQKDQGKDQGKYQGKDQEKQIFENQTVVFTGFRDKDMEQFIIKNKGKIGSSVSSKTSLVVYVEGASGNKITEANKLGIKKMTVTEFKEFYKI